VYKQLIQAREMARLISCLDIKAEADMSGGKSTEVIKTAFNVQIESCLRHIK